ncbi:MAG: glycosyltransferase family 2 protein [Bacteroidaceae bacterium]|nr:glycosyltransferase family 2 protein [Bacteroidaceae bacterium]
MHYLFYALRRGRKFSSLLIEQAAKQSFIHKLTYKEPELFSDKRTDITLLVSTYNWPEALKLCIDSASRQTVLPCEVIIADDGSGDDTRQLIFQLQNHYPELNIVHVWHPDLGFRKTIILNKALAQARGEYIIQIDGDIVLEKHFIADHIELMEPGYYVCGSRTKVEKVLTEKILSSGKFQFSNRGLKLSFLLNKIRNRTLRHYLALRYARKIDHMRGCNLAFWRSDFMAVNGYNEDLLQWGHEDSELIYRMHFAGVKKKALKMGGVAYHLWHPEASRNNEDTHLKALEYVKANKIKWCENGVKKNARHFFTENPEKTESTEGNLKTQKT